MKGYVPLHVRYGTRRVKLGWWFRRVVREGVALRLAPWFRSCLAENGRLRKELDCNDEYREENLRLRKAIDRVMQITNESIAKSAIEEARGIMVEALADEYFAPGSNYHAGKLAKSKPVPSQLDAGQEQGRG